MKSDICIRDYHCDKGKNVSPSLILKGSTGKQSDCPNCSEIERMRNDTGNCRNEDEQSGYEKCISFSDGYVHGYMK